MKKKMWGGRFNKETNHEVEAYTASILFDAELWQEDIIGSIAHVEMLGECNIISKDDCLTIKNGLRKIAEMIREDTAQFSIGDEDIHMNIERMLTNLIGDVAGKLHTARSRNDQVALDLRLYVRKQLLMIIDLLLTTQTTLLHLATQHSHTLMPGYTHLQRAQPIYLAQYWLAYISMLQRDIERLQSTWLRVNQSPLGACALNGTSLPINRHYAAEKLGFDGLCLNTLDAVSDRDFVLEFLADSAMIMMHLSRLSEELVLWSSQEFNFIGFDDAFCTGSSIMPQKKNPDVVELGRGKTGRVYGSLITLLTILKGLPLAYNKDLQEDKEPLFDTVKTLKQTLSVYNALLSTIIINTDIMQKATHEGFLNATILAEYLVKNGMPFRSAHEITGKMVAVAIEKKCQLEDFSLAEMKSFSDVFNDDIYQLLAPRQAATACDAQANLESGISMQLAFFASSLEMSQSWLTIKQQQISVSDLLLQETTDV